MTLVDVKNALFSHFMTESVFSLADDVAAIKLDRGDLPESLTAHRTSLFKAALDEFVRAGILAEVSPGLYLLTQPIDQCSQQVVLSPLAAEMIADLVNGFSESLGDDTFEAHCSKMAITSQDIERVCQLCHFLLDESHGQGPATP